jgi:hypothetical protein
VVSFTSQVLYPWGKRPQYPLDRRLSRPQNWSGWHGEEKILNPARNSNSDLLVVQPVDGLIFPWFSGRLQSEYLTPSLSLSHFVSLCEVNVI